MQPTPLGQKLAHARLAVCGPMMGVFNGFSDRFGVLCRSHLQIVKVVPGGLDLMRTIQYHLGYVSGMRVAQQQRHYLFLSWQVTSLHVQFARENAGEPNAGHWSDFASLDRLVSVLTCYQQL